MKTPFLLILILFTFSMHSQDLNLEINVENSLKTIQYLSSNSTDLSEAQDILELESTIGMISHDGQFDKLLTKSNFLAEISNPSSKTDAFRFKKIRRELKEVISTMEMLNDSLEYLEKSIHNNLISFLKNGDNKKITINLVVGGNSDGYTIDDNTFNIELQYFSNDIEGAILLITHEVYHILQQRNEYNKTEFASILNTEKNQLYKILENLYMEGTASYIANPLLLKSSHKYSKFLQQKYNRNLNKLNESFYLFESMLSMIEQKNANYELLYNLGYGGQWDSPMYFVGFEICRQLERVYGKYYIKKFIDMPSTFFIIEYIELYKKQNSVTYKFSTQTENWIYELHEKVMKRVLSKKRK